MRPNLLQTLFFINPFFLTSSRPGVSDKGQTGGKKIITSKKKVIKRILRLHINIDEMRLFLLKNDEVWKYEWRQRASESRLGANPSLLLMGRMKCIVGLSSVGVLETKATWAKCVTIWRDLSWNGGDKSEGQWTPRRATLLCSRGFWLGSLSWPLQVKENCFRTRREVLFRVEWSPRGFNVVKYGQNAKSNKNKRNFERKDAGMNV